MGSNVENGIQCREFATHKTSLFHSSPPNPAATCNSAKDKSLHYPAHRNGSNINNTIRNQFTNRPGRPSNYANNTRWRINLTRSIHPAASNQQPATTSSSINTESNDEFGILIWYESTSRRSWSTSGAEWSSIYWKLPRLTEQCDEKQTHAHNLTSNGLTIKHFTLVSCSWRMKYFMDHSAHNYSCP